MSGFDAMKDGDLILCVNLLYADAREHEKTSVEVGGNPALLQRAEERRLLAKHMKLEAERRAKERYFAGLLIDAEGDHL